ncbi:hypothetical protein FOA52_002346 [Chlamydomonas sp. UWO 241]|nr:hypothetical protein FOA52_002346 [Chlamydomonas sp. UWO 241]
MPARRGGSRKRGADDLEAAASTSSTIKDPWATTSFTWRIENFSKLKREQVWSDSFEAGICTWRLRMYPEGLSDGDGTHLAVFLEQQDEMWEPSAKFKMTVVNQADASKSCYCDYTCKFNINEARGSETIVTLPELRDTAAGFLINDTLVLTANITVECKDRFQLDTGGVPGDIILSLPCGAEVPVLGQSLQSASPFFRDALEDVQGGAPIPVDGSLGTWTYILSDVYPLHDSPALTLRSVLSLLPVVHTYNFTKLLTRLVAFVKSNTMSARRGGSRKRGADEIEAAASTSSTTKDPWATTSLTWRIKNFSKPTCEPVRSDSFEAGICTWWVGRAWRRAMQRLPNADSVDASAIPAAPRLTAVCRGGPGRRRLKVYPAGDGDGVGTHLSVFLETQDDMWEPSADYKITLLNQADASKSFSYGNTRKFNKHTAWGDDTIVTLPELRDVAAGFVINDTLVLTVDVTVEREDRFQLDAGVPYDVVLKLACGAEMPAVGLFLQAASPFFPGALEDVHGGAPIPVDGSFGTWAYILSDLYPQYEPPALTLGSVLTQLPVVHKYDFGKLLARLVAFVKESSGELDHEPECSDTFVIRWLALSERLQLDRLRELCLGKLRSMTREDFQTAITVEVEVGSGDAEQMRRVVRKEVEGLGQAMCCAVLTISATIAVASFDDESGGKDDDDDEDDE